MSLKKYIINIETLCCPSSPHKILPHKVNFNLPSPLRLLVFRFYFPAFIYIIIHQIIIIILILSNISAFSPPPPLLPSLSSSLYLHLCHHVMSMCHPSITILIRLHMDNIYVTKLILIWMWYTLLNRQTTLLL